MSKFLFLLAAGMAISPVNGLNLFSNCMGVTAEVLSTMGDVEYAMHGYYQDHKTDNYTCPSYTIAVNNDADKLDSLYDFKEEDDILIDINDIYAPVVYQDILQIKPPIEVLRPKPIRLYFCDSEDEEVEIASKDDTCIKHTNTPIEHPSFSIIEYGFPFTIWSDCDDNDISSMLEICESGTTGNFYTQNAEYDVTIDDSFLGCELADTFSEIFIQNETLELCGDINNVERIVSQKRKVGFHKEFFNMIHHILQSQYFDNAKISSALTLKIRISNKDTFRGYFIEFSALK